MTKVMLVMPPFTQTKRAMKRCLVPMGIACLGSFLQKHGIDVELLDCIVEGYHTEVEEKDGLITYGLTKSEIKQRIKEFDPDFLGVSCLQSSQAHNAHELCKLTKEVNPNICTIMGGSHPSVFQEGVLNDSNVDHIAIGEGEKALLSIINGEKKRIVKAELTDVDTLPWPARNLLPMEKYIKINMPTSAFGLKSRTTQIETSRGCPFSCVFCCTTNYWGKKFRGKSPKNVLAEIKHVKAKYKVEELDVLDANMIVDRKRFLKVLQGLKKIGIVWANPGGMWAGGLDEESLTLMKESGCYQVTLAIENADEHMLNDIIKKPTNLSKIKPLVKHCKKIGLDTHAFFINGFPEETKEHIHRNYEFAKELDITSATFNIVQPLPGSELWNKYGPGIKDLKQVDLKYSTIPHPTIPKKEMEELVAEINKKFNSSIIYRNPRIFMRKYIKNLMRRMSFQYMRQMFRRQ